MWTSLSQILMSPEPAGTFFNYHPDVIENPNTTETTMGGVTREWLNSILGQNIGGKDLWIHEGPIVSFKIGMQQHRRFALITVEITRYATWETISYRADDRSETMLYLSGLGISLFPHRAPTPVES